MKAPRYKLFSGSLNKNPLWLEAVESFESACERMERRAQELSGPYFVFCHETGMIGTRVGRLSVETEGRRRCEGLEEVAAMSDWRMLCEAAVCETNPTVLKQLVYETEDALFR